MAGYRRDNDGSFGIVATFGVYWSNTVSSANAVDLLFNSSNAFMSTLVRAGGLSVRCLKD
jgi:hypothetical protein